MHLNDGGAAHTTPKIFGSEELPKHEELLKKADAQ